MATRDEEIICSASDETTTNNENLKRYLHIVYFYHRSLEAKNKIKTRKMFIFCKANVLILVFVRVITQYMKISLYLGLKISL